MRTPINPPEGLKLYLASADGVTTVRENAHQPARGIETRIPAHMINDLEVRTPINPPEGLKLYWEAQNLWAPAQVRTPINPPEGLKQNII